MRTTLVIEDDVLNAAKAIAAREGRTVGQVVSDLARQTLQMSAKSVQLRNGVALLPDRPGSIVTTEDINLLRDELP
ncbi:CopG family transcriptional regulator [Pseudomonas sp. ODNR1LW]|nr:CopG family transcriptional regulator [Pseudomonas sp. ODNR1LW]